MLDQATIEQLNRGYVCPTDAGPAWREAEEAGVDMSLLEQSLKLDPWERLLENQRALSFTLVLEQAGKDFRERLAGHP